MYNIIIILPKYLRAAAEITGIGPVLILMPD